MSNIIIVRNEHPLELSAKILAGYASESLKEYDYDVDLHTIIQPLHKINSKILKKEEKINPVSYFFPINLKLFEIRHRPWSRTLKAYSVAEKNPTAIVISFHNFEGDRTDSFYQSHHKVGPEPPENFSILEIPAVYKTFRCRYCDDYLDELFSVFQERFPDNMEYLDLVKEQTSKHEHRIVDIKKTREEGLLGKEYVEEISKFLVKYL